MATLQKVTETSRHILVIGLLSIVGIFLFIFLFNFVKGLHPPPPPPPTVSFGKLPVIAFPQTKKNTSLQFSIDTLSGSFPDFGDRATVYKIQQSQPTLLALTNAKAIAAKMGYVQDPIKISDEKYQWRNSEELPKTLLMNIFTNDFFITSLYQTNQDVILGNNLGDQNKAIDTVTAFLQNATLLPQDVDTNKTKATLLHLSGGQLSPATSLSDTQIVEIDFFQSDMNKLPLFYPEPTHSTMNVLVGGGSSTPQIVVANFIHQTITQTQATYPIITARLAFDMLKKGQGYIAAYDGTGTTIAIHNVVLGYYMSDISQHYLLPIIVFEGSNGFFGYVPAIMDEWTSK